MNFAKIILFQDVDLIHVLHTMQDNKELSFIDGGSMQEKIMTVLKRFKLYTSYNFNKLSSFSVDELNCYMRSVKKCAHSNELIAAFDKEFTPEEKEKFGETLRNIECIIEQKSIQNYLSGETLLIDEKLKRCQKNMFKEANSCLIDSSSHILLVGSGAMPITAVIIAQALNCKVTCIDNDQNSINLAKKWIEKLNLSDLFSFVNKDIFRVINFSNYTHLIITGHITNKNTLLQYLKPNLNNQKILLRSSIGLYQYVYDYATNLSGYKIIAIVKHNHQMPYTSYCLKPYDIPEMSTPYYEFSLGEIKKNYFKISTLLPECDKIFYAVKANGEKEIIKSMHTYKVPFEVCSIGEFETVKSVVGTKLNLICSLPVKNDQLIEHLYSNGCRYFVFDSWSEYEKLNKIAPDASKVLRLYVTDISESAIAYGMKIDEFEAYYVSGKQRIDGVTFYNIPNLSISHLLLILERCLYVLKNLDNDNNILNIGGNYRFDTDLESGFYEILNTQLRNIKKKIKNLTVYAEPGRTIVKSAGQLVTKVISVNKVDNKYEVYLNAGIPSGILYAPKRIELLSPMYVPRAQLVNCNFFGITCSKKLLFDMALNFLPQENDFLMLTEMGTYSFCKANHFHGWELPSTYYR